MKEDIRYIQRFENFEKSFLLLEQSLLIEEPSVTEKAGVIQFFEITFELSWKLMKDYLSYMGYDVKSPRETIKIAYSIELIDEGSLWLDALMDRNATVHIYDQEQSDAIYCMIKEQYFQLLQNLYEKFKGLSCLD